MERWETAVSRSPSSLVYHTRTLTCSQAAKALDTGAGGWIKGFFRVVHFGASPSQWPNWKDSFIPFHGLSPVKSLRATFIDFLPWHLLNLTLSFPLLEDLTVITWQRVSHRQSKYQLATC